MARLGGGAGARCRDGSSPAVFKVAPKEHIRLWREGVRRVRAFGRYPVLLVSLHADTIYTRYFDFAKTSPEDAAAVRIFLDEQHGLQARLAASLRDDPAYGGLASPENIACNQRLIAALDWLSGNLLGRGKGNKDPGRANGGGSAAPNSAFACAAETASSTRLFSILGLFGRRALRFAPRESACTASSRRKMSFYARWTTPNRFS
ncbi:MAG TPA: DUF3891 family protein [Methylocella sp.]|nr:DUF3891 family protein [Methylocella sp.]